MPIELKSQIVRVLRLAQAPLPLALLPGYWGLWGDTDRALAEMVERGVVVSGPMIPQRTWSLPEFQAHPPKPVPEHPLREISS